MPSVRMAVLAAVSVVVGMTSPLRTQERLPPQIAGVWRITRVLSVPAGACWSGREAEPLVGSLLQYGPRAMRWKGGPIPLLGVTTHMVTPSDLASESAVSGTGAAPSFEELGIHAHGVLEVNLQHEDADITGATTEVPGDAVLVAGPGRIVVSACGAYLEARRVVAPVVKVSPAG